MSIPALLNLWVILAGTACVAWTAWELSRAFLPGPHTGGMSGLEYGAVDMETGRHLEVTLDRRTRDRRTAYGLGVSAHA